jgi:hypothetical protein
MNKVRGYIRKNLGDGSYCTDFLANIFTAPTKWNGNEVKPFLDNQIFLSRWRGSDPDFGPGLVARAMAT